MPVYEYKAIDGGAKGCAGVIDAETPRDAREKLRLKKIYVTNIKPVGEVTNSTGTGNGIDIRKYIPLPDFGRGRRMAYVSQFTRQLSTLLSAGIPLAQALTALVEQTDDRAMQTVIRDVREKIAAGTAFGEVLAQHPKFFSPLYRSMVRAGEASGDLDTVLTRIADFMQKQTRLRGKIVAAMTYPAILFILSICVVIFLMTFVVPQIVNVLEEQKIPMPLPTQIVTAVAGFMTAYWYVLIILIVAAGVSFKIWKGTENGKYRWDRAMLRAPLFGGVLTKVAVSRFSTTFSVLLKSGLPALDSLRIVKDVVGNVAMAKVIGDVHDSIIEGTDISTPIKKSGFFPPVVGYMIAVGEQTGELENLLDRISSAYDEEVDLAVQKMTALIEPIMIIFMAATVGTIIASVILPLMQASAAGGG